MLRRSVMAGTMHHALPQSAWATQRNGHAAHTCSHHATRPRPRHALARSLLLDVAPLHTRRTCMHSSLYDNPALYTNDELFSEASYWDNRYKKDPVTFEWYRGYASLRPLILQYLPPTLPLLQLGVGTSNIQYDMVTQDSYVKILNVDYAPSCIQQLRAAHASVPQLEYQVADCRDMSAVVAPGSYSGVLDKGTLDALLCGENDEQDALLLLSEACRVLEPGGVYFHISHTGPRSRLRYLQNASLPWASIEVYEVGQQGRQHGPYKVETTRQGADADTGQLPTAKETYSHWVYACRKRVEACGLTAP